MRKEDTTRGLKLERHSEITPSDLAEWVFEGPQATIIDLRDETDYKAGHIPGAIHAPLAQSADLVARIPDDGTVVLVCANGASSREGARLLALCGRRRVVYLQGGQRAWVAAGYPVGS